MEQKILFLDLDGTLLNDQKEISDGNRKAVFDAINRGHVVAIATGRPLYSAIQVTKELGLVQKGCYCAAFNGAVIYDMYEEKSIYEEMLDTDTIKKLFEEARKSGIYAQYYDQDKVVTREYTQVLDYYIKVAKMNYRLEEDCPHGEHVRSNKVLLCDMEEPEKLVAFQQKMKQWENGRCHSLFSCDEYLEYCPIKASKGQAILKLAELLGIPAEQTIAAGDERNDISMIIAAGIGAAMHNANEAVKQAADYITEHDNNQDGVAEIIEKFMS